MKRPLFSIMIIALCLMALIGCTQDAPEADAKEVFCRVVCVKDDGIIVWQPDVTPEKSYMFVKLENSGLEIDVLDTVVITYSDSDLKLSRGTFLRFDGIEQSYSYILENPQCIRHTTEEEPTYG